MDTAGEGHDSRYYLREEQVVSSTDSHVVLRGAVPASGRKQAKEGYHGNKNESGCSL
jgi:hypothetical protein